LLNLDAAGAGGKIILFQSGPEAPWLLTYYSRVPHPYGQAAGEEIFQSNIIPSDTDFRIFRDYGGLVGKWKIVC
jgi:Zn-dependent M28 family amino/carboxypeptidase